MRIIRYLMPLLIIFSCNQNDSKQFSYDFCFKIISETYQLNSHFTLQKNIFLNGLWCPSFINYNDTVFLIKRTAKKKKDEWISPDAVNLYNLIRYSDLIVGSGYHPLQTDHHPGTVKMNLLGCDYVGYDTLHFVISGEKIKKFRHMEDLFRETGIDSIKFRQGKTLLNR